MVTRRIRDWMRSDITHRCWIVWLICGYCAICGSAWGFDTSSTVRATIPDARLAGSGSLYWFGFHVYDARLYISAQGFSAEHMTLTPFALDLTYARAFTGAKIADKGREQMDVMGLASPNETAAWAKQLTQIYPDVKPGDHLIGVFIPGQGTTFYFNEKLIGQMPGDDFARAFFSIWLDSRTSAPDLRAALLAGTRR